MKQIKAYKIDKSVRKLLKISGVNIETLIGHYNSGQINEFKAFEITPELLEKLIKKLITKNKIAYRVSTALDIEIIKKYSATIKRM